MISALTAGDTWTAPKTPGAAHLSVVLEDSRGGVDCAAAAFTIVA